MDRGEKEERVKRIRIGLTGMGFVFLLVVLGTAVSRSGNDAPPTALENLVRSQQEPNEPLAEIGAAPSTGSEANQDGNAVANGATGP